MNINKTIHIFHHDDADGFAAGYIAKRFYESEERVKYWPIKTYVMNYNTIFPIHEINKNDRVIIVDYSVNCDVMKEIQAITKDIIWIDHHITAIDKYKDFDMEFINYFLFNGVSASALTYLYFDQEWNRNQLEELSLASINEEEAIETLTRIFEEDSNVAEWQILINDWDVWRHKHRETKPFIACLNTILNMKTIKNLDKGWWLGDDTQRYIKTAHEVLTDIIGKGNSYIDYRNAWSEQFMKKYGYETIIDDGCRAFIANLGNANSEFFGDLIHEYGIVGTYCFNGKEWTISLYSVKPNVDCGVICKKYGGGGHKGAAGFVSKEIPDFVHNGIFNDE